MSIEEVKVPVLAESVADATVLGWHKQPGEAVREGEKLVDIETDKVVVEVPAPKAGLLTEILKTKGDNVLSAEVIAHIDTSKVPAKSVPPRLEPATRSASQDSASTPPAPAKTGPAVRKIAAEQGIDPATVPHKGDRVTKADLLQQQSEAQPFSRPPVQATKCIGIHQLEAAKSSAPSQARGEVTNSSRSQPADSTPSSSGNLSERFEERVPMTRLRKRVAERLLTAQHEHAILTTFNEINMKAVMDLRNQYKEAFEKKHGVKLGFMSFFTKAAVAALQKFPIVNASSEGDDIIYHGYYDIGIAVNSPRGLVVPILRDVDAMSFADVEKGIVDFARRARDAQLNLEDLTGGTFSITNGGIFGSMLSTPILNPPQSAILGMHNIVERPVAENGQVVIRPVMYVALSYDHRLIDGRDAVQFLVTIKQAIEDPSRLLLDI